MGTQLPLPQRGTAPTQFSAHICCGQMVAWIKMPLSMELGLSPGDFVLDGDNALPSPKRGQSPLPNFRPIFIVACIKMPLGMEVGLSPGDFVLDGDPAPLNFRPGFITVIVISLEHCTSVRRYWFVQVQVQV